MSLSLLREEGEATVLLIILVMKRNLGEYWYANFMTIVFMQGMKILLQCK